MNKKLMLTAMLVVGVLIAPAAKADHFESDWCGHYCGLIDSVLNDLAKILGSDATDRAPSDAYVTDKASDRSGRDIARTDAKALRDGRDSAPSKGGGDFRPDFRPDYLIPEDDSDVDVICLACGPPDTPKDGLD